MAKLADPNLAQIGSLKVVIVVHQESLLERPRIHKLSKILGNLNANFEVWKFGEQRNEIFRGIRIRNLIGASWRKRPAVVRYLVWMLAVFVNAYRQGRDTSFFAVGFDSAFPVSVVSIRKPNLIFDNIDNISLTYRWPRVVRACFWLLERWVSGRAQIHVIPTRSRWKQHDPNLRVVTNTPSREMFEEAKEIATRSNYRPGREFTIYLNGWLSRTRGIRTLIRSIHVLQERKLPVRVIVAGRPSGDDAEELLKLGCVDYLGMLTNAQALATYYRSHIVYVYYDPAIEGNRLAASQKWTDCWATNTPFVSNVEIETLSEFVKQGACFTVPYWDSDGLAELVERLIRDRSLLEPVRANLQKMNFRFWDEEMLRVINEWLYADSSERRV